MRRKRLHNLREDFTRGERPLEELRSKVDGLVDSITRRLQNRQKEIGARQIRLNDTLEDLLFLQSEIYAKIDEKR